MAKIVVLLTLLFGLCVDFGPEGEEIVLLKGLSIGPVGKYGRSAIHADPVEAGLVKRTLQPPVAGGALGKGDTESSLRWKEIQAGKDNWFKSPALRGGYLYASVESPRSKVMILEAAGHSLVYVNGVPRGGDVYGYGWVQHPVPVRKGKNEFFFRVSRARVRAKLVRPPGEIMMTNRDMTLPDFVTGEDEPQWAAVRVINTTSRALKGFTISCRLERGPSIQTPLPVISPMTSRKVGFRIPGRKFSSQETVKVTAALVEKKGGRGKEIDSLSFDVKVRLPGTHHARTFISSIDGSVQYYCVTLGNVAEDVKPALFLSLHGAAVWARNQAACYKPKSWGHVVVPTNRRPYGFDWEDWGRLDAMEVLAIAEQKWNTDPKRTYLTGHSMGGHGVWYLGAVYPGRFAAIGPSAGWISFWSYAGKEEDKKGTSLEALFAKASNPSDTLALSRNYLHHGIYILHGEQDDNVPVDQARTMREHLSKFHADFAYYERPGAGHWWGGECCDWLPMFDFFKSHIIPDNRDVQTAEFATVNPGVSSQARWVTIWSQDHPLEVSSVRITQDVKQSSFSGTTENVACLALDVSHLEACDAVTVRLDGQTLADLQAKGDTNTIWLVKKKDKWSSSEKPGPGKKGPHRYGTFKDAFRHRVLFVYSSQGTPEENEWSYNKARYDAETFWYRGNASVDVIPDSEFDPAATEDRSVIIYGNRDTNRAWGMLLENSPVQVARGRIQIGEHVRKGEDLGCYFVRPRPDSDHASVGVVGGTGLEGMKGANANLYFIAGSGFPDVLVFGSDMLERHFEGVLAVGYFGADWSVENGEIAWRDE